MFETRGRGIFLVSLSLCSSIHFDFVLWDRVMVLSHGCDTILEFSIQAGLRTRLRDAFSEDMLMI